VLAVRLDEEWLLLDNMTLILVGAREATHYHSLLALDLDIGVASRVLVVGSREVAARGGIWPRRSSFAPKRRTTASPIAARVLSSAKWTAPPTRLHG
jgi:hypothetical protein